MDKVHDLIGPPLHLHMGGSKNWHPDLRMSDTNQSFFLKQAVTAVSELNHVVRMSRRPIHSEEA